MPPGDQRRPHWQSHWAIFPGDSRGRFAMYFVDLGAVEAAPVVDLPVRLDVSIRLPAAREDGMPATSELPLVQAIEDRLSTLAGEFGGAYVGRILVAGTATLTCYLPSRPEAPPAFAPDLPVELTTATDPGWEYLLQVLGPDGRQRHLISDLELVHALADEGDRLETARPVHHVAAFAAAGQAEAAAGELRDMGFDVEVGRGDRGRYRVDAVRTDPVAPPSLHQLTWSVRRRVEAHKGQYGGWSSCVVR